MHVTSIWTPAGRRDCQCSGSIDGFAGAEALGGALMLLFFATIGAGAGSLSALRGTGWLTAFITIQLTVHMAVIFLGGVVIARLPMQVSVCPVLSCDSFSYCSNDLPKSSLVTEMLSRVDPASAA